MLFVTISEWFPFKTEQDNKNSLLGLQGDRDSLIEVTV